MILDFGNRILNTTPKAQYEQKKKDKLDFIKTQIFSAKNTIKRVKKTTLGMGGDICCLIRV